MYQYVMLYFMFRKYDIFLHNIKFFIEIYKLLFVCHKSTAIKIFVLNNTMYAKSYHTLQYMSYISFVWCYDIY